MSPVAGLRLDNPDATNGVRMLVIEKQKRTLKTDDSGVGCTFFVSCRRPGVLEFGVYRK